MLETAARPSAAVIARARMWPVLPLIGLGFAVVASIPIRRISVFT